MEFPHRIVCTDRNGRQLDSAIVDNIKQRQEQYTKWNEEYRGSDGAVPYIFVSSKKE